MQDIIRGKEPIWKTGKTENTIPALGAIGHKLLEAEEGLAIGVSDDPWAIPAIDLSIVERNGELATDVVRQADAEGTVMGWLAQVAAAGLEIEELVAGCMPSALDQPAPAPLPAVAIRQIAKRIGRALVHHPTLWADGPLIVNVRLLIADDRIAGVGFSGGSELSAAASRDEAHRITDAIEAWGERHRAWLAGIMRLSGRLWVPPSPTVIWRPHPDAQLPHHAA